MSSYKGGSYESIEIQDDTHQNDADDEDASINSNWIAMNIKQRQCVRFVKRSGQREDEDNPLCECNYPKSQHNINDNNDSHLETDAYGKIVFSSSSTSKAAKYIRIADDTPLDDVWKLLTQNWKLQPPNLLLSVTGGSITNTDTKVKEAFERTLTKTTENMWVFTGGIYAGASKQAGEAVRNHKDHEGTSNNIACIGFAPWGWIRNKEILKNTGDKPVQYTYDKTKFEDSAPLDPHHTHYILVDNGTQNQFYAACTFRAQLEDYISDKANVEFSTNFKIPLVLMVIAGGTSTLKAVADACTDSDNPKPIVIMQNTGGAAQLIADACTTVDDTESGEISEQLKCKLKQQLDQCGWLHADQLDFLIQCVKNKHLITLSPISDDASSALNLVEAIKSCIRDQIDDRKLLQWVLTLGNVDMASEEFPNGYTELKEQHCDYLFELFFWAVKHDKLDFVKHFWLKNVQPLITSERFMDLYNKEQPNSLLGYLLNEYGSHEMTLTLINNMLLKLMDHKRHSKLITDSKAYHLFIWSLLKLRKDMAGFFFGQCESPIGASLNAVILLKKIESESRVHEHIDVIQKQLDNYSKVAVELLNICYSKNEVKTHQLLRERQTEMGMKDNCLKLAVKAENKEFIGHQACQSLLDNLWMGEMTTGNNRFELLLCTICFPLIFSLVKWKTSNSGSSEMGDSTANNRNREEREFTRFKKFTHFYNSPFIKFVTHFAFYLTFLVLHSIVMLTRFKPSMDPLEMLTLWWIFTYICDEIRQAFGIGWKQYINQAWNRIDVVIVVMTTLGYILRLIPSAYCGQCFETARIILSINLLAFTLRILHMYSIEKKLGPILVMIENMMSEMVHFMLIMTVFICSYGLALQAILYPNAQLDHHLLRNIFYKAYFQIYGELFLEELNGDVGECSSDPNIYNNQTCGIIRCPENNWLALILLGFYILITNVMMLNLLIAMFSSVYDQIKEKADLHWNYPRLALLKEFEKKPILPAPLVSFSYIYLLYKHFKRENNNSDQTTTNDQTNELKDYMRSQIVKKDLLADNKEVNERVEALLRLHDEDRRILNNIITQLHRIDERVRQTSDPASSIKEQEQNTTVYPSQCRVNKVSKVGDDCLIELQERTESGIPHHISGLPGGIIPSTDQTFIIFDEYSEQLTFVKLANQLTDGTSRDTYRLPEGKRITSGLMIRNTANGRKRVLYMFVVKYKDGAYRVCTVSLDSNNLTLQARYMIGYCPIHPFHIGNSHNYGVLCAGSSDINRICVFSQNELEYPPDIYMDTLHHNTVRDGCFDIIDLPSSDGSAFNTICVTSHGHFCLGMFQKHSVQIYDRSGTFLTTLGTERGKDGIVSPGALYKPCTVICTSDNHILVVCNLGDAHLWKPGGHSDEAEYECGEWKIVRNKLFGRVDGYEETYYSTVNEYSMLCAEKHSRGMSVNVYPIQSPGSVNITIENDKCVQTQIQLCTYK